MPSLGRVARQAERLIPGAPRDALRPARGSSSPFEVVQRRESTLMMDVLFFGLTAVLFSLTWGLVRLCDSV
jgi:hypothetical protein